MEVRVIAVVAQAAAHRDDLEVQQVQDVLLLQRGEVLGRHVQSQQRAQGLFQLGVEPGGAGKGIDRFGEDGIDARLHAGHDLLFGRGHAFGLELGDHLLADPLSLLGFDGRPCRHLEGEDQPVALLVELAVADGQDAVHLLLIRSTYLAM